MTAPEALPMKRGPPPTRPKARTGLFTPQADSMGYKRLMCTPREPYEPKSDLVRNAARRIRVQQEGTDQEEHR